MRIIYFTSAIKEEDFKEYNSHFKKPLNPSGQNFHHNLVKSLSIGNEIEVISIRQFSKKISNIKRLPDEIKRDGNITWHYIKRKNKLDVLFSKIKLEKKNETVILTETTNTQVILAAKKFKKKNRYPLIGILTDDPRNITSMNQLSETIILSAIDNFDGYITLTEGLNFIFNIKSKPCVIMNGVINNYETYENNKYGDYILFAGSLMEKYGIYNLIDGFNLIENKNIKLIICGHHEEEGLKNKLNDRIIYLGCVDIKTLSSLEHNALMCVNPRPLNAEIDIVSYPSKVLEYLSNGKLLLSTKNKIIYDRFLDNVLYFENSSPLSIKNKIEEALKIEPKKLIKMQENIKAIIKQNYSYNAINELISDFLYKSFIK